MSKFKVFSMFDGVGGFVVGLNNANKLLNQRVFDTIYTNQFEPSRKSQDAFEIVKHNFPEPKIYHSNQDITKVDPKYFKKIKDSGINLIVGGFPCQDYSVARSKKNELGIEGKKGVLFWEIIRAVEHINPEYLILENVDRLLKSPSSQRGRDFAIMLAAFNQRGYSVEWRVINAADYGLPQRRRRVFIFVYRNDTNYAKIIEKKFGKNFEIDKVDKYITSQGLFARQFPVEEEAIKNRFYSQVLSNLSSESDEYLIDISDNFTGTIWNSGIMRDGAYYSMDTKSIQEIPKTLGDVINEAKEYYTKRYSKTEYDEYIDSFVINDVRKIEKFKYLRGAKKIERTTSDGHKWIYSEGGMSDVDDLNLPARTMLTSEGTVNRSTHFLKHKDGYRLITPLEAELIQDFPPEWTKYKTTSEGVTNVVSDRMRMFFMGNALVTGVVKRIGIELSKLVDESEV